MNEKLTFESLDSGLFEPLSSSVLRQIRGGDVCYVAMPSYNPNSKGPVADAQKKEDSKKKKGYKVT